MCLPSHVRHCLSPKNMQVKMKIVEMKNFRTIEKFSMALMPSALYGFVVLSFSRGKQLVVDYKGILLGA